MIIQCQGCAAKYFLPEDKVPISPTKVRCPKCTAVFTLVPRGEPVPVGVASGVAPGVAPDTADVPPAPAVPEGAASAQAPAVQQVPDTPAAPKTAPPQTKARGKGRTEEDRAKRLARVLVSDILCYHQDKRDKALQDGTLMKVLGEEIKKSWELYKDKVGSDLANSTNYFKEALNEILADGQEVF
jgi:predicted Zn finger-like uncharacterized protein